MSYYRLGNSLGSDVRHRKSAIMTNDGLLRRDAGPEAGTRKGQSNGNRHCAFDSKITVQLIPWGRGGQPHPQLFVGPVRLVLQAG